MHPFSPHIELAHRYWHDLLQDQDWAIDATCGNGKDTLVLAKKVTAGKVIGIDVQEEAVRRTEAFLRDELGSLDRIDLHCQSHETFPESAFHQPIKLIAYNLG